MNRLLWLALAALLLAGAVFGLSRLDPTGFADRKREFRLFFGLPKQWATGFNTDTRGLERLACPGGDAIVIVTGGQSNAANALSDPLPGDPAGNSYMMQGGACYRLRDPVLGATAQGGSLWSGLGPALARASRHPVVFVNGGVGGSQLGDWLDERSGYRRRLADQVARARAVGLAPDYVVWIQGETDAAARVDPKIYVGQMRALVAAFDADGAAVPWIVFRSTRCKDRPNNGPAIDAAIARWALAEPRIVLGPSASSLGNDARWDRCHFNGRGRELLVAASLPVFGYPRR